MTSSALERRRTRWYFGANDRPEEGTWGWADGAPFEYTNWSEGEPNNHARAEDCGMFGTRNSAEWNDVFCGILAPYVCRQPD